MSGCNCGGTRRPVKGASGVKQCRSCGFQFGTPVALHAFNPDPYPRPPSLDLAHQLRPSQEVPLSGTVTSIT